MATTNRPKNDWINLLQQANATRCEPIPKGFLPVEHWTEEYEISEGTWRKRIPLLEKSGVFQRGYYRVVDKGGRAIKRPFWKKEKPA